jgi:uncharacterized integral membrane protein (TIGR00698 family)
VQTQRPPDRVSSTRRHVFAQLGRAGLLWRGLVLCIVLAAGAFSVGVTLPVIGSPVTGLALGIALRIIAPSFVTRIDLGPGITFAATTVLQTAVVLLGFQLSLSQLAHIGAGSLPVMLATFAVCVVLAMGVGKGLQISPELRVLLGVGTGICGASAIAAVSPIIRAKRSDISYAMSTIFLFNIAAVLGFPPLGHALGLSQHEFGVFAGTAVNDTSSVLAASTTYGLTAAGTAIVVKLTRTLLIVPTCITLTAAGPGHGDKRPAVWHLVPWFLAGFVVTAAVNSSGIIATSAHRVITDIATYLVTTALVAIGLSSDLRSIRASGPRPLLLGFILWLAVSATSLFVQAIT